MSRPAVPLWSVAVLASLASLTLAVAQYLSAPIWPWELRAAAAAHLVLLGIRPLVTLLRWDRETAFDGLNVLFVGQIAWYLWQPLTSEPHWFGYQVAEPEPSALALVAIALANLAAVVGYLFFTPRPTARRLTSWLLERTRHTGPWALLGVTAAALVPVVVTLGNDWSVILRTVQGVIAGEQANPIERSHLGGEGTAILALSGLSAAACVSAVLLFLSSRSPAAKVFAISVGVFFVLYRFGLGRRANMWTHVAPLLAVPLFTLWRRRELLVRILLVSAVPGLLFINQYLLARRTTRTTVEEAAALAQQLDFQGNDMFSPVAYMVTAVPQDIPYTYGTSTLLALLAFPIPRAVFPAKPSGVGIQFIEREFGSSQAASCSFGHVGEFVADFGLIIGPIVGGFFFGWLFRWATDCLLKPRSIHGYVWYGFFAAVIFFAMRGVSMLQQAVIVLAWFVSFAWLADRRRRTSVASP